MCLLRQMQFFALLLFAHHKQLIRMIPSPVLTAGCGSAEGNAAGWPLPTGHTFSFPLIQSLSCYLEQDCSDLSETD